MKKSNSKAGNIIIVILVFILIGGLFNSCQESQYDKDFQSAQNKTWDELTPGEKRAEEDYINWMVKQTEKEGADWSH